MNLLPGGGLRWVGLLEAAPNEGGANVGVGDVRHPRRSPEWNRRRRTRHRVSLSLSLSRASRKLGRDGLLYLFFGTSSRLILSIAVNMDRIK